MNIDNSASFVFIVTGCALGCLIVLLILPNLFLCFVAGLLGSLYGIVLYSAKKRKAIAASLFLSVVGALVGLSMGKNAGTAVIGLSLLGGMVGSYWN